VEHGGGHVVPLEAVLGEILDCGEEMVEEINGGICGMPAADLLDALEFKVLAVDIASVGEAIGAKLEGVAGHEVQGEFIVGDAAEEARRDTSKLQGATFATADEERAGHARTYNAYLRAKRIDDGVLDGGVASRDAAEEKPLVQEGEDLGRGQASLVDTAERANGERGIEGSGEALAGDVAEVQADGVVGEEEVVQVIAADFCRGLEFMGNGDVRGAQRLAGQHDALDGARFLEFLFA
jgi:hypothetical protein